MSVIRLLIVDDHPVVRAGLRTMLAEHADFQVVGEAGNGREALELVEQFNPTVVLLDLRMPEMDGVETIAAIKARHPTCHLLVLTTYESDSDLLRAIEAGATGYLLKDTPPVELANAIRATARGKTVLAAPLATILVHHVHGASSTLSARELEILRLVAAGANNQEIADQLFISAATIKTHLLHIFQKLEVNDRTAAVVAALRRGYLQL